MRCSPGTKLQRCTTHLERNIVSDVRNGDNGEVADDLRQAYRRQELYRRESLGRMAGVLREVGESITVASGNDDMIRPTRHTSRI